MGGSPNLLMPVNPAYTASWASHTRRSPKSSEPGTDMFVPIGTPVFAPADGHIYGSGNTIGPATGRWVGIDLDNGLRFRCMHLSRLERSSGAVKRGDLIGYSGASGYGYEDFRKAPGMPDAHTHVTLWPTHASRFGYDRNGNPYTVDFMQYVGGSQSAGDSSSTLAPPLEDDDMLMLNITGLGPTHKVALGNGVFRHFVGGDPYEKIMKVSRIQDDWQDITAAELPAFLRTYGCDLRIWDVRDGVFVVLDPLTGNVGPGNVWTAAGVARAAIAGITLPTVDPAPVVKAVREAIAEGLDVTAAEFADELARRLAG